MAEQPAPRARIADGRQEQVLADIRASLAARDLEYAKAVNPEACALLVRMAAEYEFELSFLAFGENFTARLTDMHPPYGESRAVLHFQSWNARWSGDPGGRGLDVSEVAAWLAAYRAHPAWHSGSLYDDMKARMRSAGRQPVNKPRSIPQAPPFRGREAGSSHPALHAGLDFPDEPMARPPAGSARPAASSTTTRPAARTSQVSSRGRRR